MSRRAAGDLRLHRLADGVYLYRGFFSNSAVFVLPANVVVVDTQVSPLAAHRLRDEIARITSSRVTHVINTHYHGDHTGGNAVFSNAEIWASDDTARLMVERDAERIEYARHFALEIQAWHPTVLPQRTFCGRAHLDVGDERFELLQLGRVETPDACVVFWPRRRVLACGDGVATHDYPYLGVPFLDEGLRPDGDWIGFLRAVRLLRPTLLLPGHGPALAGESAIAARLDLLAQLFANLLTAVQAELDAGTPIPVLVERVDRKLRRYPRRNDLRETAVSQRFAIYRCINNILPERRGRGWWHDLRPSVLRRAPRQDVEREICAFAGADATVVRIRAAAIAGRGRRPLAIALLERWIELHPEDASAWGLLSDVLLDGAWTVRPFVDATEFIGASIHAARAALQLHPSEPLALLNLGAAEVFGAMVLAQPMARPIERLETALAHHGLTRRQRRKGEFFLGKAHQTEQRDVEAERHYRRILPTWSRFAYPLARAYFRSFP